MRTIISKIINFYRLEKNSIYLLNKIYMTLFIFSGLYALFTSSEKVGNVSMYLFGIFILNTMLFSLFVAVFDNKNFED